MDIDPGLGSPLVCKHEDSTFEDVSLAGQLDMMDGGSWGMSWE